MTRHDQLLGLSLGDVQVRESSGVVLLMLHPFIIGYGEATLRDAETAVAAALTRYLAMSSGRTTLTLSASQMPEEWLPALPSIRFVRLDSETLNGYYNACGRLLWIRADRIESRLTVTIGEGTKCDGAGQSYEFTRDSNEWHLDTNRVGPGFGGGTSHCECP